MTKVSLSPIILILQLALVSCVGAQSNPLIHYEFEGDYSNSGTGIVAGQPRSGATIVADPGGGLKGASNVLKFYGNDEYVKIGNDDVGSITTALTVAAWVKSDGTNWSNAGIVTRGYNWRLYISGSANGTIQCMNTEPQGSKARGSVNINEGEWHHVAGTYDGTQYILYIDGVQDGPAVPATGPIAQTTSHKFTIGAFESSGNISMFYDGYIDDVRVYDEALDPMAIQGLVEGDPVTIPVDPNSDLAAANALANPGDTIEFAEGTYYITSQIEIKDGVTYKGAGPGLTIIDGNDVTRAFVAWSDRSATDGQVDVNGVSVLNATGPTDWVLDGLTIQNCVSDTNNRQDILSASRDLLNNYTGAPYTLVTAQEENGGITDNPGWFDILSGSADPNNLTDVELQAYLDANPVGSEGHLVVNDDKTGDGGAITIHDGAVGTIANCEFLNNHTPAEGAGDDGGAINIAGHSVVTINDCLFDGNYAVSPDSVGIDDFSAHGGHIILQSDSASAITPGTTLIANRCAFLNGNAEDDAGAIRTSAVGSILRLDACWFEGNNCWDNGTVLFIGNESSAELTVTNSVFVNNITNADNSPDRMCQVRRNSKFINCTFVGNNQNDKNMIYNNANSADTDNDGVDDEMADATQVINCIFANNVVGDKDQILGSRNDSFTIAATNCLFFGNTLQNGSPADNTQRPAEETGSVSADPLLDANYVPGADSPAIDGGADVSAEGVTTDYNGAQRPQGAAYDIGAHEAP